MVDLLGIFSAILIIVIGIPTALLVIGKVVSFFVSFTATDSRTEKPECEQRGKALIVYEPGAVGLTRKVGESVGDELLGRGYEVTLAGIRSRAAGDISGYNLLLLGTPTYIGRPTGKFKKYVKGLKPAKGQVFGIFLSGTKGAPAVGLVPKVFLDKMKKPFEESGIQAKEMIFVGYGNFDYPEFVNRLLDVPAPAPAPEIPAQ